MSERRFDLHQLGVEAYLYLYPLVTMEFTRRQLTNSAAGQLPGRAPMGQFAHIPAFPSADFKAVVRPNFDTLDRRVRRPWVADHGYRRAASRAGPARMVRVVARGGQPGQGPDSDRVDHRPDAGQRTH
jgi:hypothetical protein